MCAQNFQRAWLEVLWNLQNCHLIVSIPGVDYPIIHSPTDLLLLLAINCANKCVARRRASSVTEQRCVA